MEGMRISWDELTCVGYKVTDEAVGSLCKDIEHYREEADLPKRKVNLTQLMNWKLLKEAFPFSKTQCAVFKGTGRSVFLDKREYMMIVWKSHLQAVSITDLRLKI